MCLSWPRKDKNQSGRVSLMGILLQNPAAMSCFLPARAWCNLSLSSHGVWYKPSFSSKKSSFLQNTKVGVCVCAQTFCLWREQRNLCPFGLHLSWSVPHVLQGKLGKWLVVKAGKEKSYLRLTWCHLTFCLFEKGEVWYENGGASSELLWPLKMYSSQRWIKAL